MVKAVIFAPTKDQSAEWHFYPNQKMRKKYPDAEMEFLGMDAQEGEVLSLKPNSQKKLDDNLVIEIAEGRVELIDFESNWKPGQLTEDVINWDIERIIEAWSSDD